MKKKTIYLICIVIVLLICIIAYFKPLSFANATSENGKISIICNEYVIKNGEPDIDVVKYEHINKEQTDAILTLLEKYTYRRTFGTLFSDGSMSGIGNKMLSIYGLADNSNSVFVTSSGKIVVNAKNYRMENAEQLIEQIIEIVEQTQTNSNITDR